MTLTPKQRKMIKVIGLTTLSVVLLGGVIYNVPSELIFGYVKNEFAKYSKIKPCDKRLWIFPNVRY